MKKNFNLLAVLSIVFILSCSNQPGKNNLIKEQIDQSTLESNTSQMVELNESLLIYISWAEGRIEEIPQSRKEILNRISDYIVEKKKSGTNVNLNFICTHNSRRSHLSQIWATTAAHYYNIAEGITTYSGGTEVTAFNPKAVAAIERAGFRIENPGKDNPRYKVYFSSQADPLVCYSKIYDDEANPKENFAAIMVCSEAAEDCPYVPGTELRIPLTYEDPKVADDTDMETAKYDERTLQIATEMLYVMSQVKVQL